ncbi:MAG: hypothetical protein KGY53_06910 [Wenzhouxiangellaceae bacterium]|nr:hypothetical protein [Wenzhouxiangellaceae bacterium]MBS3823613.1 hypothetical protein [Wenzhouxiangellaceae bacterium]
MDESPLISPNWSETRIPFGGNHFQCIGCERSSPLITIVFSGASIATDRLKRDVDKTSAIPEHWVCVPRLGNRFVAIEKIDH